MPLYDYECPSCGDEIEMAYKVENKPQELPCPCGGVFRSVIKLTARPMFYEGYDEGMDEYVTGYRQRQMLMKKKQISER